MKRIISICLAVMFLFYIAVFPGIQVASAASPNHNQIISSFVSGDVTDLDTLVNAAEIYMDANLADFGYSSSIDSNGRLTVTQILPPSLLSKSDPCSTEIAIASLVVLDSTGSELVYTDYNQDLASHSEYGIYVVFTTYYKLTQDTLLDGFDVEVTKTTTRFTYSSTSRASNLYQYYAITTDLLTYDEYRRSSTTSSPNANQTYAFYPGGNAFPLGIGYVLTESHYTIAGESHCIETKLPLGYSEWTDIIT